MKLLLRIALILVLFPNCIYIHSQAVPDTLHDKNTYNLTDSVFQLEEVQVIVTRQKKAITGTLSGNLVLHAEALKSLPQFLGTADLIRTMRLMPGVQTTGEGNSGLYIRGTDPSHNELLINGAPIYNAMHLMGFFSVFNSSHLSKATLIKSNVSPEYGGRLGGVLSVTTRDTVAQRAGIEGSIGIISSQGTISLPLTSKSALYISGRGTYINPILNMITPSDESVPMTMQYGFQDYNLTYVYAPSPKTKVIANGYIGNDKFFLENNDYQTDGSLHWKNRVSSIQWFQTLPNNSRFNQILLFSSYKNNMKIKFNDSYIGLPSAIKDFGYKGNYKFNLLQNLWTVGVDYTCHLTTPQSPEVENMFGVTSGDNTQLYKTHETGIYFDWQTTVFENLTIQAGLRYSSLFHVGKYEDRQDDSFENETVNREYGRGELVKYYGGLEPRISLNYAIEANQQIRMSYGLQRQYLNQVTVSTISFPTDFWVPASKNIQPQSAQSYSIGYFRSIQNDEFEFSLEAYYKHLENQLEFDGGLFDMINQRYTVEDRLLSGQGKVYGGELLIKKNKGKLTGWISYTLGWSKRQFPDIHEGSYFPAKHDRRHDFSIVSNYKLNDKWDFSAVFVYATGNAYTAPIGAYLLGENIISEYGPHNGSRMPAYHRLDLSANVWFKKTQTKESGLNISLYNAYARQNPIFIDYKVKPGSEDKNVHIIKSAPSLYRIIPSISYIFKF